MHKLLLIALALIACSEYQPVRILEIPPPRSHDASMNAPEDPPEMNPPGSDLGPWLTPARDAGEANPPSTDSSAEPDMSDAGAVGSQDASAEPIEPHPSGELVSFGGDLNCSGQALGAPDGSDGFLAKLLVPPSYPFLVEEIRYVTTALFVDCELSTSHRVEVYRVDTERPPTRPRDDGALVAEVVSVGESAAADLSFAYRVDPPIRLDEGQRLVVAVQLRDGPDGDSCVRTCSPAAGPPHTDFVSATAEEPFSWVEVADVGFDFSFAIQARGRRVSP